MIAVTTAPWDDFRDSRPWPPLAPLAINLKMSRWELLVFDKEVCRGKIFNKCSPLLLQNQRLAVAVAIAKPLIPSRVLTQNPLIIICLQIFIFLASDEGEQAGASRWLFVIFCWLKTLLPGDRKHKFRWSKNICIPARASRIWGLCWSNSFPVFSYSATKLVSQKHAGDQL